VSCEVEAVTFQANVGLRFYLHINTSVYLYIYLYIHTYKYICIFIGFFGVSCETEAVTFQANVGLRSLLIRALQNLTVNQDANIGYITRSFYIIYIFIFIYIYAYRRI
jgi:hypothetical protein